MPTATRTRTKKRKARQRRVHRGIAERTRPLHCIVEDDLVESRLYLDLPLERQTLGVRVTRTSSRDHITGKRNATLQALGISRRSLVGREHGLDSPTAGQIAKVMDLVATDLVLPSGNTVATEPHDIIQIAREQPIVSSSAYEVDGRPAASLDWSTGDHSRVECQENFNLYAWTSRLAATKAFSLMEANSSEGSRLYVATTTHGLAVSDTESIDRKYVGSRAQHVCLLRLENPDATLVWEVPLGPMETNVGKRADFVIMSATATADWLTALIEETGTSRIMLAEPEIIELARKVGALL